MSTNNAHEDPSSILTVEQPRTKKDLCDFNHPPSSPSKDYNHNHKHDDSVEMKVTAPIRPCNQDVWEKERNDRWMARYAELKRFQKQFGHTIVKKEDDGPLFQWIVTQRSYFAKDGLSVERKALLDELGFVYNLNEAKWRRRFEELLKYHSKHDSWIVNGSDDAQLAQWSYKQRVEFHNFEKGKKSKLSKVRFKLMKENGYKIQNIQSKTCTVSKNNDLKKKKGQVKPTKMKSPVRKSKRRWVEERGHAEQTNTNEKNCGREVVNKHSSKRQ
mmetsp:Transcript_9968/g.12954  ORF Transcript_9968/g.12954 Transcript_9968/m.12954 type:complete len:272 (-) Transcript_9968:37-852(-)